MKNAGVNERAVSLGGEWWLVSGAVVVGAVLLVFAFLLSRTDARDAWTRLRGVSIGGFAIVLATYLAGFVAETASWLQTLASISVRPRGLYRLSKVLMVGNAVENITPVACFGGEPIKMLLLNRYEGIPYASALASLVITRTTNVMALILFIATGLIVTWRMEVFPSAYREGMLVAFLLFAFAGGLFFLVQNQRVVSRLRGRLGVRDAGSRPERLARALDRLRDVEDQLLAFYSREPRRLILSMAFAIIQWLTDVIAIWVSVRLLGSSITFLNAFAVQASLLMVLASLFFVPSDLGTQDAALAFACGTVTGSLSLGVAVAALRRARDLLWVVGGFIVVASYARRPTQSSESGEPSWTCS